MRISARNHFSGKVTHMVEGPVSTELTIEIAPKIGDRLRHYHPLRPPFGAESGGSRTCPDQGRQRVRRRRLRWHIAAGLGAPRPYAQPPWCGTPCSGTV